jgi:hypothetical protein
MVIHHYAALKVMTWVFGGMFAVAAVVAALDPTKIIVAAMIGIPGSISSIGVIYFGIVQRRDARQQREDAKQLLSQQLEMKSSVDGMNTDLRKTIEIKTLDATNLAKVTELEKQIALLTPTNKESVENKDPKP